MGRPLKKDRDSIKIKKSVRIPAWIVNHAEKNKVNLSELVTSLLTEYFKAIHKK